MSVDLVLCPLDNGYSALAQLAGESGWTKRVLVGQLRADGVLQLMDQAIVDGKLANGWRYCGDTTYTIFPGSPADRSTQAPRTFVGSYESRECEDGAVLRLSVHAPAAAGASQVPLGVTPTPTAVQGVPPPPPSGSGLDIVPSESETRKDPP
jgi:hypothetical protein